VLYSPVDRRCGNRRTVLPADEGQIFALNRKETRRQTCQIPPGRNPVRTCNDGEKQTMRGLRITVPIDSRLSRTTEARVTAAGLKLSFDSVDDRTSTKSDGTAVAEHIVRSWRYDIRFERGGCRLAGVTQTSFHDGRNTSDIAIQPVACFVTG
jgi:hypothetical protein